MFAVNNNHHYGDLWLSRFAHLELAQITTKVKRKEDFDFTYNLVPAYWLVGLTRAVSFGGNKNQAWCPSNVIWHDWGNHKITHSLTVNNLLSSSLFFLHLSYSELSTSRFPSLICRNYSKSNSNFPAKRASPKLFEVKLWLSRKVILIKDNLSQTMTKP